MDPSTYKDAITGADAVVHTVGMLLEDDYKDVLHSQSFEDLTKNVQSAIRGQNPLDTKKAPKSGLTYERINRDTGKTNNTLLRRMFPEKHGTLRSNPFLIRLLHVHEIALTVANEAGKAGVESFVFISAAFAPPMVPNRYLTTKREAESALLTHPSKIRSIIFRPGFMSTPERPITLPLAGLLQVSSAILGNSVNGTIPFAQALSTPPLAMETLARAVMNAVENPEIKGIIDVGGIEELAHNPYNAQVGASKKVESGEKKDE